MISNRDKADKILQEKIAEGISFMDACFLFFAELNEVSEPEMKLLSSKYDLAEELERNCLWYGFELSSRISKNDFREGEIHVMVENMESYLYEKNALEFMFRIENGILTLYRGCTYGKVFDVVVPDNVSEIGADVFKDTGFGCDIDEKNCSEEAYYHKLNNELPSCCYERYPEFLDYTDDRKPRIRSVILPPSVVRIGDRAFLDCRALRFVKMPGVKFIGEQAFMNCHNLRAVEISAKPVEIGEDAFWRAENLRRGKDGKPRTEPEKLAKEEKISALMRIADDCNTEDADALTELADIYINYGFERNGYYEANKKAQELKRRAVKILERKGEK